MSILSTELAIRQWEVWLIIPGHRSEVLDLGVLISQAEAVHLASSIGDWLILGTWYGSVLDQLAPDAQDDLWAIRQGLKFDGTNLASVRVTARPFSNSFSNTCGEPIAIYVPGDDDGDESDASDTDIDEPDVLYYTA